MKLTGRTGPWTIGVLDVQTDDSSAAPGDNLFVGRVKHDVFEESEVGAIFTNGDPSGTGHSALAGFDFNFRRSDYQGDQVLTASTWFQTTHSNRSGDPNAFGARIGYPNDRIRWMLGFAHIGEGYDPKPRLRVASRDPRALRRLAVPVATRRTDPHDRQRCLRDARDEHREPPRDLRPEPQHPRDRVRVG